jgi:hypothetical protein
MPAAFAISRVLVPSKPCSEKKLHRDVDELFLTIWRGKSHGIKVSTYLP